MLYDGLPGNVCSAVAHTSMFRVRGRAVNREALVDAVLQTVANNDNTELPGLLLTNFDDVHCSGVTPVGFLTLILLTTFFVILTNLLVCYDGWDVFVVYERFVTKEKRVQRNDS